MRLQRREPENLPGQELDQLVRRDPGIDQRLAIAARGEDLRGPSRLVVPVAPAHGQIHQTVQVQRQQLEELKLRQSPPRVRPAGQPVRRDTDQIRHGLLGHQAAGQELREPGRVATTDPPPPQRGLHRARQGNTVVAAEAKPLHVPDEVRGDVGTERRAQTTAGLRALPRVLVLVLCRKPREHRPRRDQAQHRATGHEHEAEEADAVQAEHLDQYRAAQQEQHGSATCHPGREQHPRPGPVQPALDMREPGSDATRPTAVPVRPIRSAARKYRRTAHQDRGEQPRQPGHRSPGDHTHQDWYRQRPAEGRDPAACTAAEDEQDPRATREQPTATRPAEGFTWSARLGRCAPGPGERFTRSVWLCRSALARDGRRGALLGCGFAAGVVVSGGDAAQDRQGEELCGQTALHVEAVEAKSAGGVGDQCMQLGLCEPVGDAGPVEQVDERGRHARQRRHGGHLHHAGLDEQQVGLSGDPFAQGRGFVGAERSGLDPGSEDRGQRGFEGLLDVVDREAGVHLDGELARPAPIGRGGVLGRVALGGVRTLRGVGSGDLRTGRGPERPGDPGASVGDLAVSDTERGGGLLDGDAVHPGEQQVEFPGREHPQPGKEPDRLHQLQRLGVDELRGVLPLSAQALPQQALDGLAGGGELAVAEAELSSDLDGGGDLAADRLVPAPGRLPRRQLDAGTLREGGQQALQAAPREGELATLEVRRVRAAVGVREPAQHRGGQPGGGPGLGAAAPAAPVRVVRGGGAGSERSHDPGGVLVVTGIGQQPRSLQRAGRHPDVARGHGGGATRRCRALRGAFAADVVVSPQRRLLAGPGRAQRGLRDVDGGVGRAGASAGQLGDHPVAGRHDLVTDLVECLRGGQCALLMRGFERAAPPAVPRRGGRTGGGRCRDSPGDGRVAVHRLDLLDAVGRGVLLSPLEKLQRPLRERAAQPARVTQLGGQRRPLVLGHVLLHQLQHALGTLAVEHATVGLDVLTQRLDIGAWCIPVEQVEHPLLPFPVVGLDVRAQRVDLRAGGVLVERLVGERQDLLEFARIAVARTAAPDLDVAASGVAMVAGDDVQPAGVGHCLPVRLQLLGGHVQVIRVAAELDVDRPATRLGRDHGRTHAARPGDRVRLDDRALDQGADDTGLDTTLGQQPGKGLALRDRQHHRLDRLPTPDALDDAVRDRGQLCGLVDVDGGAVIGQLRLGRVDHLDAHPVNLREQLLVRLRARGQPGHGAVVELEVTGPGDRASGALRIPDRQAMPGLEETLDVAVEPHLGVGSPARFVEDLDPAGVVVNDVRPVLPVDVADGEGVLDRRALSGAIRA
ncbi:hypothetical protein GCM10023320_49850 [Pseudonocardia adelaidensis]|uniref:Uncharacterized protein n=1 Tax=Pseudonocardia adelaidensis TaxID=648754 RepID=A0ABP9NSE0_9PSEU